MVGAETMHAKPSTLIPNPGGGEGGGAGGSRKRALRIQVGEESCCLRCRGVFVKKSPSVLDVCREAFVKGLHLLVKSRSVLASSKSPAVPLTPYTLNPEP